MTSGRFAPFSHAGRPHPLAKTASFPRCYGGEFKGDFPAALGDSQHVRIPPAAHTYQSDVETVHRLEEDEFFDLESFSSRGEFLAKVHTYQLYFNLVRTNSHKENLSPWQIIQERAPRLPIELCLLPPVLLDYDVNDQGGYDVPRLPYFFDRVFDRVLDRVLRLHYMHALYFCRIYPTLDVTAAMEAGL